MRIATVHLQSEAAECGLACLAMVAGFHGLRTDLRTLRQRFPVSLKGMTLAHLMRHATRLELSGRALRCELDDLPRLQCPCILHWNLDHFVVLESVRRGGIVIVDPARGRRRIGIDELSASFTGVALELTPTPAFAAADTRRRLRLSALTGQVVGWRRALAGILVVAASIEVVALAHPFVAQFVVDGALVSGDRDLLTLAVFGGAVLVAIDLALKLARGWMSVHVDQVIALQWTTNVFAHLLRLPLRFFEQRHLGDIVSRFNALNTIRNTLTSGAIGAALDGMMAVLTLVLMVVYSATLTWVALVALASYAIVRLAAYRPLRDASEARIVLAARESTFFLESIRAIVPLKLHGRLTDRLSRWQNLRVDAQNRETATQRLQIGFATLATAIAGAEEVLLFSFGGASVLDRTMSLGMLLAFLAYRTQFGDRTKKLIDLAIDVRMLGLHAERLADIVLEPPESDATIDIDPATVVPRIEMRDLSFRYAEGEPWILRHVDCVVEAGESLAIVGASGCGKSTLLKLLLGLHEPTEGEIRIGACGEAVPFRQLGRTTYRRVVGTVLQDDTLLSGSLADNIACFDPLPDREAIESAARAAAVHDEIIRMPMGYHTLVGDLGSSLSGGQRQRVLLARALYKRPRLLILDEATSHLDLDNERRVNAAVQALALTRIVVAHRPETIASAQRVVMLDGGRIVRDVRLAAQAAAA
jgi:ATP-binding cassette subfamily B protein RaxB